MLKKVCFFLTFIILLSGCTKKEYEEISFSSWGSITEVNIIKKVLSDFQKENPNIKVNFIHIPQNYFQKIHLLFASNTAPDVIFINNHYIPIYAKYLEKLDSQIDKNEYFKASIDALSYNQSLLAIPRDISNLLLYINLDLVTKYKKISSLNDLLELSKSTQDKNVYGISYENDIYWALPYLTYFGGGILNENNENIFYSKESQEGLLFYKNLRDKHKVAPTKSQIGSSTLLQMFLDKKIAIYLSGRWSYPKIKEKANFNWTIEEFPTGKSPQYADASGWAISKNSKNKDASLKLIKFLSDSKNIQLFTETELIVPARIQTAEILNNNEHNQKAFILIAEKSTKTPVNKNYKKDTDYINTNFLNK